MNKLYILLFALVFVVSLAGCAASQPQSTTVPPQNSVPTTGSPPTTAPTTAPTTVPTTAPTTVPQTTTGWEIVLIIEEERAYEQALQTFYEDEENIYKFAVRKSAYIDVHYSNGTTENIVDALYAGRATLQDLGSFGFSYYTVPKNNGTLP